VRQPGPGPRIPSPAWAKTSPVALGRSRPFDFDQRLRVRCGRSKPPRAVHPENPNPFLSLPRSPRCLLFSTHARARRPAATDGDGAGGATASPLAGARVHRRVGAPPSSGISVAPRSPARRTAPRQLARPLSTRGPRSRWIWSAHRRPEHADGGWRKKNQVSSSVTVAPLLCVC
jgi:hypothetical protein